MMENPSMSISLSPEIVDKIKGLVDAGSHDSPDSVVSEALRLLQRRDELRGQQLQDLREEISLGLDDLTVGRSAPLEMDAVRAKVARRLDRSETTE